MTTQTSAIAAYRALADSRARNYDRAQDISPRQQLILLQVCERTGTSLAQTIATGEFESAHTWNDHVRPTLNDGSLGSATGVFQFIPSTFHHVIKVFGSKLLAATDADSRRALDRMDLGDGPFDDAQVRRLIQETVDGKRGAADEQLQLLRHNFAVLAFARHYLSLESGATTPEEDYLFHFLGAAQGKRVLALARGPARHTLSVKPRERSITDPDSPQTEGTLLADVSNRGNVGAVLESASALATESSVIIPRPPGERSQIVARWGSTTLLQRSSLDQRIADARARQRTSERQPTGMKRLPTSQLEPYLRSQQSAKWVGGLNPRMRQSELGVSLPGRTSSDVVVRSTSAMTSAPAIWTSSPPWIPPPVAAEWGLPADSATVTGNLGMFYRDGKGQRQPYTWAQFLDNIAKRVRAKDQPALVRAKYGVGFAVPGGDLPERGFDPKRPSTSSAFRHAISERLTLPQGLATGTLSPIETRTYQQRLAELVRNGEDEPIATLPADALAALRHLNLLADDVADASASNPKVQKAIQAFRALVGKEPPDDPAHQDRLLPAERVALQIYDQRLARYAAYQAAQAAALGGAPDLHAIRQLAPGLQEPAMPYVRAVQKALAAEGLLKQPTRKVVTRDKKRRKRVTYTTLPFSGEADKATIAALSGFQFSRGLRKTQGVLDPVTLAMLSLAPMGSEVLLPLSGPYCELDSDLDASPCPLSNGLERNALGDPVPAWRRAPANPWRDTPKGNIAEQVIAAASVDAATTSARPAEAATPTPASQP